MFETSEVGGDRPSKNVCRESVTVGTSWPHSPNPGANDNWCLAGEICATQLAPWIHLRAESVVSPRGNMFENGLDTTGFTQTQHCSGSEGCSRPELRPDWGSVQRQCLRGEACGVIENKSDTDPPTSAARCHGCPGVVPMFFGVFRCSSTIF